MSAAKADELLRALVRVSALATSRGDLSYQPALEGWRRYYGTRGDRPQDYDRLSLVYANDELVSIAALKLLTTRLEAPVDVIWLQLILTAPEFQQTAATVRALSGLLLARDFQGRLRGGYLVARTPNPLVYEATRRLRAWANRRSEIEFSSVLPAITAAGELAPVPDAHRAALNDIVGLISRPEKFNRDTFVVSGYYAAFGALYKDYTFACTSPEVRDYFARHVRWDTQDGLFFAVPFRRVSVGGER